MQESHRLDGQVALLTGAGSGIGRASALALAADGATLVLVGRREDALRETALLVREQHDVAADRVLIHSCDITDPAAVAGLVDTVLARFAQIDILLNNAGTNVPRRALADLSWDDWQLVVRTNLDGSYCCVHAVLPHMRRRGRGTLIHIGSYAAHRPSALSGAAYTAAKAGLGALSAVINAEERQHGIRSSVIMVGDTDTPLLDRRPAPPPEEKRARMMQPEDVAACVVLIAALPLRATLDELVLTPTMPA